jgi:transposase
MPNKISDMAFLRIDKKHGESYLRICKTERIGTQVKQTTLQSLGALSSWTPAQLQALGKQFQELGGETPADLETKPCSETGRYNYGFPLIISHLCAIYDLDTLFRRLTNTHKLTFSLRDAVVLMLCNRWHCPASKLRVYDRQDQYIGLPKMEQQWLYRSLDKLAASATAIQTHLFKQNRQFFKHPIDVVFYDVTTFYFDSDQEEDGTLRQKGFGKDGKIGKTQILLGLLLDKARNPIGYELYPGDKYEGHTLTDGIAQLRRRYNVDKVVVVADSGMLNQNNLEAVTTEGHDFIVGERLKNLPKAVQTPLLELAKYETLQMDNPNDPTKPIAIRYRTVKHKNRTILCTYSETRARKDCYAREEKLAKAQKMLKNPANIGKKAKTFFLKSQTIATDTGEQTTQNTQIVYILDQERIDRAALFDGFKAITTNAQDLTPKALLQHYKQLYQIEQTFRTFKSFLQTRPMFHWTDERIRGHFALCFISFSLLNYLQQTLKQHQLPYSEQYVRDLFDQMQISKLLQNEQTYYLPSAVNENATKVLQCLGLKAPLSNAVPVLKIKYLSIL